MSTGTKTAMVLHIKDGREVYAWRFDDAHRAQAINVAARWAVNGRLSFTWHDAFTVARNIRRVKVAARRY